ncbi:hypothetical protein HGB24_03740 [Candidatus Saccharibacteria bacterium]|nr:hypothetical protein [Candidatus Saccharibacteria bacterium]
MCKTSGELEKENIGNPYILNDGVESMLVSVENVDAVTEEDILEYSQRCELARRNVEIVYENLASSDGSDEIVYDDKVVVFRNNVDIDYSLTRVSQYSDIYVRYFRNITFVIARLALHLTCKVIGTPLTR